MITFNCNRQVRLRPFVSAGVIAVVIVGALFLIANHQKIWRPPPPTAMADSSTRYGSYEFVSGVSQLTPIPSGYRPSLEENAAFEHAVCTAALGKKKSAEAEFMSFIRTHPDSPLAEASAEKIAAMHGADVPPAVTSILLEAEAPAIGKISLRARLVRNHGIRSGVGAP